jgi:hypothetical protein
MPLNDEKLQAVVTKLQYRLGPQILLCEASKIPLFPGTTSPRHCPWDSSTHGRTSNVDVEFQILYRTRSCRISSLLLGLCICKSVKGDAASFTIAWTYQGVVGEGMDCFIPLDGSGLSRFWVVLVALAIHGPVAI